MSNPMSKPKEKPEVENPIIPVSSLLTLSTRACIKNIDLIQDVGRFEYWKIRKILMRIQNPLQLNRIEQASPQIAGEDVELWRAFIARDIPDWEKKNYAPKNRKKWYHVYRRYMAEQEEDIKRDEEVLRNQFSKLQKEKQANETTMLNFTPKVPRDRGGFGARARAKKELPDVLRFNGGSRTKMNTGKGVILRAKREAAEHSAMGRLSKPSTIPLKYQIREAPQGMVDQYRAAAQPGLRIHAPQRGSNVAQSNKPKPRPSILNNNNHTKPSMEAREARLQALTSTNTAAGKKCDATGTVKETFIGSDSSAPSSPISDIDDLFDEKPQLPSSLPLSSQQSSPPSQQHSQPRKSTFQNLLAAKGKGIDMGIAMPRQDIAKSDGKVKEQLKISIEGSVKQSIEPTQEANARGVSLSPPSPPGIVAAQTKRGGSPAGGIVPMQFKKRKPVQVDIFMKPKKVRRQL